MVLSLRDLTRKRRIVMPKEKLTWTDEGPKNPILAGTTTASILVASGPNPLLKMKPTPTNTSGVTTFGRPGAMTKLTG
jgi:hypothetical protein